MRTKALIFLSFMFFCTVFSCKESQRGSLEEEPLKQLMADDWDTKTRGLFALMDLEGGNHKLTGEAGRQLLDALDKSFREAKAFIDRLKAEGKSQHRIAGAFVREFPPNSYGDFTRALVILIASKRVEGSLPRVFEFLAETNYSAPPVVLTLYGDEARDFLAGKAVEGTTVERKIAVSALSLWVDPSVESDDFDMGLVPPLSQSEKDKIKPIFLKSAMDPDYNVRYLSLEGLRKFGTDPAVIELIKKMAVSDNEKFIRDEARDILTGLGVK